MQLDVVLRKASSLRVEDAVRITVDVPVLDGSAVSSLLDQAVDAAGVPLQYGDLLTVYVRGSTEADLAALLAAAPGSRQGPGRLNGTLELGPEDNHVVDVVHGRLTPRLPLDIALVHEVLLPAGLGQERTAIGRQVVVYPAPATHGGYRLDSAPAFTVLFVLADDDQVMDSTDPVVAVIHRGRARVFRDEFLDATVSSTGLPPGWQDPELHASVDLVLGAGGIFGSGAQQGDRIAAVFTAVVAATTRLGEQELALSRRAEGAAWKAGILDGDLAVATAGLPAEVRDRHHYRLASPCVHYVQQLQECHSRVRDLSSRGRGLFAVVSAMADRALLAKTEGARRAAVVAAVLTSMVATVGLFAALSAIPLAGNRSINPGVRTAALVGVVVVGAVLLGLLLADLTSTTSRSSLDDAVGRLAQLLPDSEQSARPVLEAVLGCFALAAFGWGVVRPHLALPLLGLVLVLAALVLHSRRARF